MIKDIVGYNYTMKVVYDFFRERGFIEVPPNIDEYPLLSSCIWPNKTIKVSDYYLPQTNDFNLDSTLLKRPELTCVCRETIQYDDEVGVDYEFAEVGELSDLRLLLQQFLKHIDLKEHVTLKYEDVFKQFDVKTLDDNVCSELWREYGPVVFLESLPKSDNPELDNPMWNVRRNLDNKNIYNVVHVFICGLSVMGGTEKAVSPAYMREDFYSLYEGKYAKRVFEVFGKEKFVNEMEKYLSLPMIHRFTGGIDIENLMKVMKTLF